MSANFIFLMLMGHMLGDYLFQTNYMAINKKKDAATCAVHCSVYTGFIVIMTGGCWIPTAGIQTTFLAVVLIFLSHFVLDHTELVDKWLDIIGSRSYGKTEEMIADFPREKREMMGGYYRSYAALVQTAADNTLHLLAMYLIFICLT